MKMRTTLLIGTVFTIVSPVAISKASTTPKVQDHQYDITADTEMMGEPSTPEVEAIETYLLSEDVLNDIRDEFGEVGLWNVRRAYANKIFTPLWTKAGVADLKTNLVDVFAHGIVATDVYSDELDRLANMRFNDMRVEVQAKADVELSLIWLRLAKTLSGDLSDEGHMTRRRNAEVVRFYIPDSLILAAQGQGQQEVFEMVPEAPQYEKLMAALAQYRQLGLTSDWEQIAPGDLIEPGDNDPRIVDIRTRLKAEGYDVSQPVILDEGEHIPDSAADKLEDINDEVMVNPDVYDEALVPVIEEFQRRHGLEPDGLIESTTISAMNETIESKISRIAESMDRWRQQGELGDRYIWANIPSFTAEGWNNGMREVSQRTIVGKERFATPEFSDEVEYVVANPKWYLPVSIVRRQKLPKIRKDATYAARNGYNIFDRETGLAVDASMVDWTEPGVAQKYRFIQEPGENNALGQMKIIFPNQYSIYLHGTPGEHLFEKAQRAFSSGCVRLEDPIAMARWIARHDEDAEVTEIKDAIEDGELKRIDLEEHLPVHITYMSVTINDEDEVVFWRDIYDRVDESDQYIAMYEEKRAKYAERIERVLP